MKFLVGKKSICISCFFCLVLYCNPAVSQQADTTEKAKQFKNVVRYNLSSALLFGIDKCVIIGYERVIRPNQSISVNFGRIALPKLITINTDSFQLARESSNKGFNASIDYRFYLSKENKYQPPHGLYIGPYYSFNNFTRENRFDFTGTSGSSNVTTSTDFTIHTVGFELGYQFVLWKRMTLDFLMVGPGLGFYDYKATIHENLDPEKKKQILDALQQLLTQKFPGMNYVFADDEISGNGTLKTSSIGYRFLVQIGFNF